MSDLPGTSRRDIDPEIIKEQFKKLAALFARFMDSRQTAEVASDPTRQHPKCFIIMPFGVQDLEDLYNEFILPVLSGCELDCARGDDIFGSNVVMEDVKAALLPYEYTPIGCKRLVAKLREHVLAMLGVD